MVPRVAFNHFPKLAVFLPHSCGCEAFPRTGTRSVDVLAWLMLRLTLAPEGCPRVEFGADGWVDLLDFDGLQVCCVALRLLTGNFFDLAVPPTIHS
jgi:hypothetical protein